MVTAIEDGIALESARMGQVLAAQRASFTAAMPESLAVRIDRLDRAIALLVNHAEDFAKAVSEDFGHRSREQSMITDIAASVGPLKHALRHVGRWSRSERKPASSVLLRTVRYISFPQTAPPSRRDSSEMRARTKWNSSARIERSRGSY